MELLATDGNIAYKAHERLAARSRESFAKPTSCAKLEALCFERAEDRQNTSARRRARAGAKDERPRRELEYADLEQFKHLVLFRTPKSDHE